MHPAVLRGPPDPRVERQGGGENNRSQQPMRPLHRRHVLYEVGDRRVQRETAGRQQLTAHQGEGVEDQAGPQSGDERSPHDLQQQEHSHHRESADQRSTAGWRQLGTTRREVSREPGCVPQDDERQAQVSGEPVVTHARAVHQTTAHHQPAHDPLQGAEPEQSECAPREWRREIPRAPEQDEGNEEHHPDQPCEQPVQVLPEEDDFEVGERHPPAELLIFGKQAVAIEDFGPLCLVQRWDRSDERLPVDDRQA